MKGTSHSSICPRRTDWRVQKWELHSSFGKALLCPTIRKVIRVSVVIRGTNLISVGSKLLSMTIPFRLTDAVNKVIREEQCDFRKDKGSVNQIFNIWLIIEKCLSYQKPLVLSFIDYWQAFDSGDRKALSKVLSLYINVISAMYRSNIAAVKVRNEVSSWFHIKSRVKQGSILFPFILLILMDSVLTSTAKAMGEHAISSEGKTFLNFSFAADLSILMKMLAKWMIV